MRWLRHLSWVGSFVASAAALCVGCQGGYPIAATACDEWCEASHLLECGNYNPADCVATCEQQRLPRAECRAVFDSALQCLQSTPDSELECASWLDSGVAPCLTEQTRLYDCTDLFRGGNASTPPPPGAS